MKHVLILFTDQQRYDTIAFNGNEHIQTPHLDALARESAVFSGCVTPSPVCIPARLSLLSGQYPARTGCNNNNSDSVFSGEGFYARITDSGYNSCCVGKMHNIWDTYGPLGFRQRRTQEELAAEGDEYMGYIRGKYPWVFDYHGMRSEMYYVPQLSQLSPEDHPTQWVGDKSVEFINNFSGDEPMFLFSSFIHPHPPYAPPAPWQKLYRDDPPAPLLPDAEAMRDFRAMMGERCSCERLEISRQDILRTKNFYYACVSFVDYQVGRIIEALKAKGMYDDTLIVFASDHGDMMGDYGAIGKRTMVDSSCHVPLIIRYPGRAPETRGGPCSLTDIAPTLLAYAGVEYERGEFDGIDLFSGEGHEYVFSQHGCGESGVYMVTDGKSKLVYLSSKDRYFFFDSIPEVRDTYDEADPRVRELRARLDAYRASDVNKSRLSKTYEPVTKTHPHYTGRMDQAWLHDAELGAIPPEYTADITQ